MTPYPYYVVVKNANGNVESFLYPKTEDVCHFCMRMMNKFDIIVADWYDVSEWKQIENFREYIYDMYGVQCII